MDKIEELRQRLKNDRQSNENSEPTSPNGATEFEFRNEGSTATSSTGTIAERYISNSTSTTEPDERPFSRLYNRVRSTERTASNIERKSSDITGSTPQVNKRVRSRAGRSSEDNSQNRPDGTDISASTSESKRVRRIGNLETDEPIPPRSFSEEKPIATPIPNTETKVTTKEPENKGNSSKSVGSKQTKRGIKQLVLERVNVTPTENQGRKPIGFTNGKTLTKQESEELKESFMSSLADIFNIVDQTLWKITGDDLQQPIWSDMTEKELETFSNVAIRAGQRNAMVASAVRGTVNAGDYVQVGMVIGPRFIQSVQLVRENRIKKNANRSESRRERIQRIRSNN